MKLAKLALFSAIFRIVLISIFSKLANPAEYVVICYRLSMTKLKIAEVAANSAEFA
jgi:hypothetical protein